MALYHLEFITKTHTRTHFLTYYLQRPWTPLTLTHKKHSFTYKLASLSSSFPICVPKEMDKKPTMKHNLHLTSVEGEPKTLTKEQYEIARAAALIAYMQKNELPPMMTLEDDKPETSTKPAAAAAEDAGKKPMP